MKLLSRSWAWWLTHVLLGLVSAAFAYWLAFTVRWLYLYLPHGGGG